MASASGNLRDVDTALTRSIVENSIICFWMSDMPGLLEHKQRQCGTRVKRISPVPVVIRCRHARIPVGKYELCPCAITRLRKPLERQLSHFLLINLEHKNKRLAATLPHGTKRGTAGNIKGIRKVEALSEILVWTAFCQKWSPEHHVASMIQNHANTPPFLMQTSDMSSTAV